VGRLYQKWKFLIFFGPHSHPPVAIEVKFCTAKRTHVPVGPAKFDVNWCNESPLRGEKPDFWPVSKFNTGSLPLRSKLPVLNCQVTLYTVSICHYWAGKQNKPEHQSHRSGFFKPSRVHRWLWNIFSSYYVLLCWFYLRNLIIYLLRQIQEWYKATSITCGKFYTTKSAVG